MYTDFIFLRLSLLSITSLNRTYKVLGLHHPRLLIRGISGNLMEERTGREREASNGEHVLLVDIERCGKIEPIIAVTFFIHLVRNKRY